MSKRPFSLREAPRYRPRICAKYSCLACGPTRVPSCGTPASVTSVVLIRLTPNGPLCSVADDGAARPSREHWRSSRHAWPTRRRVRTYLATSRWPNGYRCPRCGHAQAFELPRRGSLAVQGVRSSDPRSPPGRCCTAAAHRSGSGSGRRTWSRRTRRGCPRCSFNVSSASPGTKRLGPCSRNCAAPCAAPGESGCVARWEVDETYIGNQDRTPGGARVGRPALVVGAVEVRGRASGRVRLQVVPDASGLSLTGFVHTNVEPGTTVITDGWQGYAPLSRMGLPPPCQDAGVGPLALTSSCRACIASSATSRHGSAEPTMVWTPKHPASLSGRVHVPVQPAPHADGRVPVAARAHGSARDAVCLGAISTTSFMARRPVLR